MLWSIHYQQLALNCAIDFIYSWRHLAISLWLLQTECIQKKYILLVLAHTVHSTISIMRAGNCVQCSHEQIVSFVGNGPKESIKKYIQKSKVCKWPRQYFWAFWPINSFKWKKKNIWSAMLFIILELAANHVVSGYWK